MSIRRVDRRNRVELINIQLSKEAKALKERIEGLLQELERTAHRAMHDLSDELAEAAALADDGWASLDLDQKKQLLTAALHGAGGDDGNSEDRPKASRKK